MSGQVVLASFRAYVGHSAWYVACALACVLSKNMMNNAREFRGVFFRMFGMDALDGGMNMILGAHIFL